MITAFLYQHPSPIGTIQTIENGDTLYALAFEEHWAKMEAYANKHFSLPDGSSQSTPPSVLSSALQAYFAGDLMALNNVKTQTLGTDFQQKVWQSLRAIPVGETWSYQQQAHWLNKPSAVRAVAAANGKNPISLCIPCHRVIGSNGSLTGYAGGIERKEWLLTHEQLQNTRQP